MAGKIIPLEEIAFVKFMGPLSEKFKLDNDGRLPWEIRHSQLFKGFRDGYLDFPHKYEIMPQWKLRLIEFFTGGDYITAYELSYFYGQRRRNREPFIQFEEAARA